MGPHHTASVSYWFPEGVPPNANETLNEMQIEMEMEMEIEIQMQMQMQIKNSQDALLFQIVETRGPL